MHWRMLPQKTYPSPTALRPMGGIALGVDRLATLLCGGQSIREVMPFPKTQKAQCLLSKAPDTVEEARLDELRIRTIPVEDEE